jgi:CDP-diacylglycerol--serine O-phosphatidyltransferase
MKEQEHQRMVYILPNLMTAGNLCCGFMAILKIFEGTVMRSIEQTTWVHYYEYSLFFILAAFIFDMLDGRLARLGGQETPFGREFDSLADIVSFGIAPALLVFKIVLNEMPARIGWIIAFIYLACGALRLARFNVLSAEGGSGGSKEFTGFPIPAAAGLIASITLLLLNIYETDREIGIWKYVLAGLMLFLSFMMFSKYRYPSFKGVDWKTTFSVPKLLILVLSIMIIILHYRYALAFVFTIYLLYGFLRPYISRSWRKSIEEDELEDDV